MDRGLEAWDDPRHEIEREMANVILREIDNLS